MSIANVTKRSRLTSPIFLLQGPSVVTSEPLSEETRSLFLESPETFWAHFGWLNSLCIFKVKVSWGTKLCSYFNCYSLYNLWKEQLNRISGSQFYEWLFGPEKFSRLSRNGSQFLRKLLHWPMANAWKLSLITFYW